MASGRTKGPVCGIENCRSKWYDEGEDGYLYCENGHRSRTLIVGQDEDDFTPAARTRTRSQRNTDEIEKVYKYFKGQQAYDLYLKCLQLILRHQIWYLVHEKGLPVELETVVFALWALRIAPLEGKIAHIHDYDSQSQVFTTDESDIEHEGDTFASASRKEKLKGMPGLTDALALCYLGILTLRLPITPGDICDWATNGKLPYLRAIKHVPKSMKERLPARYHAYLDPNGLLQFHRFHSALVDLETSMANEYGIIWPTLNRPLLLFRYLKELALPLELYNATTRLAEIIKYDFTPPMSMNSKLGIRHLPEAQLISCLVICVKLLYPFDDLRRYPMTTSEPAATTINWEEWQSHMSTYRRDSRGPALLYTKGELANLQEKDIFSMSGRQLDQYLDWYKDAFIDWERIASSEDGQFRNALYEMFPTTEDRPQESSTELPDQSTMSNKLDVVKAVHSSMHPRKAIPNEEMKEDALRPGQGYAYYRKLEDLPEQAKHFYEEAARVVGLSLDMLIKAVFFTERKIERWRKDEKRRATGQRVEDAD
ncbi:hypothetical protein BDV96DRAFT_537465 [Lophiotrema nucula]|uniref:RRN7-type domain-containing protein n=1 Tax=Lophiotrema nucula TaxID=690887 RepID=A0A6A5ZSW4_9PLEO|nr:hypothetical protein BDV96DRAFT_537465 [Lophiotrema nucula]